MRVIYKPTGQIGDIPDDKFDASLFGKVDGTSTSATSQPMTQMQSPTQPQIPQTTLNIPAPSPTPDLNLFVKKATAAGKSLKEINDFISQQQQLSKSLTGGPTGADAVAEVMKQGGSDFINKGKDKDARAAIAAEILKLGGVNDYRKQMPLADLLSPAEETAQQSTVDLQNEISTAAPMFGKANDKWGGTGPVSAMLPSQLDFLRSKEGRDKIAEAEKIKAQYAQAISGKVISDNEIRRLQSFLPSKDKTETQNGEDLNRLKDAIEKNVKIFELGKREGLTPNEAFQKYGKQVFNSGSSKSGGGSKFTIETIE